MTLVIDSSAVVAALIDEGPDGEWARGSVAKRSLSRPAICRSRSPTCCGGQCSPGHSDAMSRRLAPADLGDLRLTTFGFDSLAARVWALHPTVTAYDAAYVALAEGLGVPLLTLDRRSPGIRAAVLLPAAS